MTAAKAAIKLEQELRRGIVVLAVLSRLNKPEYGYSLGQALAERGMPIEEGTLYPLSRRLQEQGLLTSEWRIEDGPPRRYDVMSADGRALFKSLTLTWHEIDLSETATFVRLTAMGWRWCGSADWPSRTGTTAPAGHGRQRGDEITCNHDTGPSEEVRKEPDHV